MPTARATSSLLLSGLCALAACSPTRAAAVPTPPDAQQGTAPAPEVRTLDPDAEAAAAATAPVSDACASDADCTLTFVPEGGCCPMLCAGRPVTASRARSIAAQISGCTGGRQCPHPACAPSRQVLRSVCDAGRCVGRLSPASREE